MDSTINVQELISNGNITAIRLIIEQLLKAIEPREDPYKKKVSESHTLLHYEYDGTEAMF